MYPYVTRMYWYVTRMYSYVLVCYSYVLVWCFSHDRLLIVKTKFLPDSYTMLMRPNLKAETAVHGCHCPGDMAVRMRKVLARPWVGV